MSALRFLAWNIALTLFFFLAADPLSSLDALQFYIFQTRDLVRAGLVASGSPIFFGPEITGGGNLPGPFYYYLLAVPLLFGGGWEAAWWWMVALCLGAGLAGAAYLRSRVSAFCGLVFLAFFACAPITRMLLRIFLNVSYLTPVAVGAMLFIAESCRAERREARERAFLGACFLLGLGVQLHLSILSWLFALFFLHAFPMRKEARGASRRACAAGFALFMLPLTPFFAWRALGMLGVPLGQPVLQGGAELGVLPTFFHFTSNLLSNYPHELFAELKKFMDILPIPLLILAALRILPTGESERRITRAMLTCAAFGFIPFSYYFVAPIGYRYGMGAFLPLLVVTAICFDEVRKRSRNEILAAIGGSIAVAICLLFFLGESQWPSVPALSYIVLAIALFPLLAIASGIGPGGPRRALLFALPIVLGIAFEQRIVRNAQPRNTFKIMPGLRDWQGMWQAVYFHTGWSYEEASRRLYYVYHHLEQDPAPSYESANLNETAVKSEDPAAPARPHGFFVTMRSLHGQSPREWLLNAHIQTDIKRALQDGSLEVGERMGRDEFSLIPYWVKRETHVSKGFHDSGAGYFGGYPSAPPAGALVLRWNHCPGRPAYCESAATVTLQGEPRGTWRAKVKIEGAPLSQVTPWVNPDWTENLRRPYLELGCGSRREKFLIADSIGYNRDYGVQRKNFPFNYNNSFVAPFTRELTFRCSRRPDFAAVGSEGGEADKIRSVKKLAPLRLEGTP